MARWITGIILAIGAVSTILFVDPYLIKSLIVLLSLYAATELLSVTIKFAAMGKKAVGSSLTALGVWINLFSPSLLNLYMFIFAVLAIGFCLEFFGSTQCSVRIKQTAFFVLSVFYVTFLFSLIGLLTELSNYKFWIFLTLGATHLGDTGAYIFGKLFGKHKLAPTLSPGKTIEGVFGAVIFGMGAAYVVKMIFYPSFHPILILVLGGLVAIVGVIGDLSESLLKRGFGVKDMGNMVPGHGGILDRMDSLMFTAPIVYFISFWI
jgi:phosphatidate cytidylyltransferase